MTCLCEDKEYFRKDFFFYLPANFEHNNRITYVVKSKISINENIVRTVLHNKELQALYFT